jgi:S-adenosylmethionine hydrolase
VSRPVVSLLTDFGPEPAAICRGVILGIAPDAQIVDISHAVRKYTIRDGAWLLWCALPYLPLGAHVAVVDPGVGTDRRAIGIRTGRGDALIGPDNGLLIPAAERLGGIAEARTLDNAALALPVRSSTFHGRDLFAPVAAHLAMGIPFADIGASVEPADLVALRLPQPKIGDGALETSVVYVDSFGNARLAGFPADLEAALGGLEPGRPVTLRITRADGSTAEQPVTWERTFGAVALGATLLYEDSFGTISLADNQGNVAQRLGLLADAQIRIDARS